MAQVVWQYYCSNTKFHCSARVDCFSCSSLTTCLGLLRFLFPERKHGCSQALVRLPETGPSCLQTQWASLIKPENIHEGVATSTLYGTPYVTKLKTSLRYVPACMDVTSPFVTKCMTLRNGAFLIFVTKGDVTSMAGT